MSEYHLRLSQHLAPGESAAQIQADISTARQEYAALDRPENSHEYLGVVAELAMVLAELAAVMASERTTFPDCQGILEFHQSCVVTSPFPQEVYTFGLQVRRQVAGQERRRNVFISWIFDRQADYHAQNQVIDQFLATHQISEYDDGSGIRCRIES